MTRVHSFQRRYWIIAMLGSVAFHAAILFIPLSASDRGAVATRMFRVALQAPDSNSRVEGERARAEAPARKSMPTPASETAPQAAPAQAPDAERSTPPAPASEDVPKLAEAIAAPPEPSDPPATTSSAAATAMVEVALARTPTREAPRSIEARAPEAVPANSTQNSPADSPALPSSPPLSEAGAATQAPTPAPPDYFKNTRNLFAMTRDSIKAAAVVSNPDQQASQDSSMAEPASQRAISSVAAAMSATVPLAQEAPPQALAALPPVQKEPQEAPVFTALDSRPVPRSAPSAPRQAAGNSESQTSLPPSPVNSNVNSTTSSSTENSPSTIAQAYFAGSTIFAAKSTDSPARAAQIAKNSESLENGAASPTAAETEQGMASPANADNLSKPMDLKDEQRFARAMLPSPSPDISLAAAGDLSSAAEPPIAAASNDQPIALATAVQPTPSAPPAPAAPPVSAAPAELKIAPPTALAPAAPPVSAAPAELKIAPPAALLPPAMASSVATPMPSLAAPAEPALNHQEPAAIAPHYDSVETLASRVLAELSARKIYPAAALRRKTEGTVTLLLSIEQDGRLASAAIQSRSGSAILDEAALSLARGIFPIDISLAAPVSIVVPIEYRIPR